MQFIFMKFTWTLCFYWQRWVWAYRKDHFNVKVNTTDGVERKNRTYKHQFLADIRDKTLKWCHHSFSDTISAK